MEHEDEIEKTERDNMWSCSILKGNCQPRSGLIWRVPILLGSVSGPIFEYIFKHVVDRKRYHAFARL